MSSKEISQPSVGVRLAVDMQRPLPPEDKFQFSEEVRERERRVGKIARVVRKLRRDYLEGEEPKDSRGKPVEEIDIAAVINEGREILLVNVAGASYGYEKRLMLARIRRKEEEKGRVVLDLGFVQFNEPVTGENFARLLSQRSFNWWTKEPNLEPYQYFGVDAVRRESVSHIPPTRKVVEGTLIGCTSLELNVNDIGYAQLGTSYILSERRNKERESFVPGKLRMKTPKGESCDLWFNLVGEALRTASEVMGTVQNDEEFLHWKVSPKPLPQPTTQSL